MFTLKCPDRDTAQGQFRHVIFVTELQLKVIAYANMLRDALLVCDGCLQLSSFSFDCDDVQFFIWNPDHLV